MTTENTEPGREDAVAVYRYLRDTGRTAVVPLAEACFPLTFGSLDPLYPVLIKRSIERVFDAVTYLRAHGVTVNLSHGEVNVFELWGDRDLPVIPRRRGRG